MSAYALLLARVKRMYALRDAAEILGWDQQVMMPPGGVEARAAQMSALSASMHEILVAPETGRLLAEAERSAKTDDERAVLREVRLEHDRAVRVPTELVEALSLAAARGFEAWVEAKKASDFARFRKPLAEILELRRKYAAAAAPDVPAYEALFQDFEPWIPLADARRNLSELRDGLRPLVERARKREAPIPTTFDGHWPKDKQEALAKKVCAMLGYDFARGRLDTSPHPFSAGGAHDARITTRYDERTPVPGLLGAVHEAGHAMYMQGQPAEHMGTPLGDARDLVVHESQSRLWENHVGRSLGFWEKALPMMRETFPGNLRGAEPWDCWAAVNDVRPTLIRVDADELTYHMHVALRFEIEEALVSGKLPIQEVPHRWNEIMRRDLGLTPPDDAHGCLQDMHWSGGAIGYFPTYSLGSMLSAQLMQTYVQEGRVHHSRISGEVDDFPGLLAWLRQRIHSQGKRYTTPDLIVRATGKPLSPGPFLSYASAKYDRLWA
ncbi:MAG TPA: carboxypeptidase M32 [Candidatus Thermoplasmatota archaeon]|nr:carboxypeptidase M32 [Candidatus Thermoplasmatota archaeon]